MLVSSDDPENLLRSIEFIIDDLFRLHANGNEWMTGEQLRKFLYDLGVFIETEEELGAILRDLNTEHEGLVTFTEFYVWYKTNDRFVKMEETVVLYKEAAKLFKKYDLDGNGRLDEGEFKEFYEELTHTHLTTKVSVQDAMNKLDLNGDGYIEFNEFIAWLKWF
jgi:Ca2+-binding EF-hand superfamily protein